jgi:benzylsuccinate CoA-transferase BbsF subunit
MRPDFLHGIRFADLTWAGAGPFSTKIFSDFGAEVIKVESVSRADPVRLGGPFRDGVAGLNRSAVLAALRHRRRTGRGMKIDLAQVESTINCVGPAVLEQSLTGSEPERTGNRSPHHAPHNLFRCRGEDRWCAVAVLTDAQWQALARVIGTEDPGLTTATNRLSRVEEVEAAVAHWTADRDAWDVMETLQRTGVPAGVVVDPRDLIECDAQIRHRGYWQVLDHPELGEALYTAPPYRLDGERVELTRPPLIGEHTDEVLASVLGYSAERIAALRASGAIETPRASGAIETPRASGAIEAP